MEKLKLLKIPNDLNRLEFYPKYRKEYLGLSKGILLLDSKFQKVCDYREYWSATGGTCYVVVWYHSKNVSFSISGTAGGYGYDKASAALFSAFISAGFKFSSSFGGAGFSAITASLELVAKKIHKGKLHTIVVYP